ncbi:MAG: FG-GAP-like repeat-containing protein [Bacteroidota bacterium]|nr:FG-GAP-like repeat-containing protein [Bacteroidota bacterium]
MKNLTSVLFLYTVCFLNITYSQTFTRITDTSNPVVTDQHESGGGCWVDVNNDGWLDLFVANGNLISQNNSLYINRRDGNFTKVITGAVVNDGGSSIGGAFSDYNNDGNPDLFVTNRNFFKNFFYNGNGDSTFIKVITGNIVTDSANSNCGHWVDIDKDGDLDLFVLNFQGNDFLYLNSGAPLYNFTKIDTAAFLLNAGDFSIPASWGDYNNDRLPDLFVGNAGIQNDFIYKNNGNLSFTRTTINDGRSTLGASFGDYNNDGNLDLFAANFLNQNNILYKNSGSPDFIFTPIDTGIVSNNGGSSVGSCWGDVDNDGDLDLFVSNDNGENNFLYLNNGAPGYGFTRIITGAIVNDGGNSFGSVFGDYNNDGAIDLFVANRLNQNNFLYLNNGNGNKWLGIKCRGTVSNRSAIGTKVKVKAIINGQSLWQIREVQSQSGYNSENLDLNFGLGNSTIVDSIIINWISGTTSVFTNQSVNRYITISEDGTINSIKNNNLVPDKFTLYQNYPNPFNPSTIIKFALVNSGNVTFKIYDELGREIKTLVNEFMNTGTYEITVNGKDLVSGIYFYRIEMGNLIEAKKMLLIK